MSYPPPVVTAENDASFQACVAFQGALPPCDRMWFIQRVQQHLDRAELVHRFVKGPMDELEHEPHPSLSRVRWLRKIVHASLKDSLESESNERHGRCVYRFDGR